MKRMAYFLPPLVLAFILVPEKILGVLDLWFNFFNL